jgi:hypothetical protein
LVVLAMYDNDGEVPKHETSTLPVLCATCDTGKDGPLTNHPSIQAWRRERAGPFGRFMATRPSLPTRHRGKGSHPQGSGRAANHPNSEVVSWI